MPKRPLKGQAEHVNMPGVGLPAQMRLSITRRMQYLHTSGARSTIIWSLAHPITPPTVNGTPMTSAPQPQEFQFFCNMFAYRRWAVYAVDMVEDIRCVNQYATNNPAPGNANTGVPSEMTVGATTVPSGAGVAVPLNFDSLTDQDFDNYMTFNARSRTWKVSAGNGCYSRQTIRSSFETHEILGVPKSQVYEPHFAGMCTATATYVQPADQSANSNQYRCFRVTGIYPSQYHGSIGAINTPGELTDLATFYDAQVTYHMLMFNDMANDQDIGTPVLDEEGNHEMDDGEWTDDDQRSYDRYTKKLSNSLKKIKMSAKGE